MPTTGRATCASSQNVIERAVLVCDAQVMHAHHLPPTLQTAEASGTVMTSSLEEAMEAYEKDVLQDALKSARGNRAKAARLLRPPSGSSTTRSRKLRDRLEEVQGLERISQTATRLRAAANERQRVSQARERAGESEGRSVRLRKSACIPRWEAGDAEPHLLAHSSIP